MKKTLPARIKSVTVAVAAASLLAGCATSGNPKDPIEGFNRAMFAFNEGLDAASAIGDDRFSVSMISGRA